MCRLVGNHQHTRCMEKAFSNYGFRPVTVLRFRDRFPKGQKICLPQKRQACFGAADGSRTHLSSLGSLHSTDELQPHKRYTERPARSKRAMPTQKRNGKRKTHSAGFWEKSTCKKASAFFMVGVTGLEPMASWSRTKRDTKLRHTPKRTRFSTLWYYNIFHP